MATIKLDFKQSTWDKSKPNDIKGAKLSSALKNAEKALADEKKKSDASSLESCLAAMTEVASAAQECSKKECDAKKHKDIVTALKKFDSECQAEIKRLQAAIEKAGAEEENEDDGEVPDDELFGIKLFKECVKKAKLKNNFQDGVSFCFGVHKKAEECKLVFLKKKNFYSQLFKKVYQIAKKNPELGLKRPKLTYGAAYRDGESKETLVLHIADGAPTDIPGMLRKLEKWRKANKQDLLPFKELVLRSPSGQPLQDIPDPEDDADEALQAESPTQEAEEEELQASTAEQAASRPTAPPRQPAAAPTAAATATATATPEAQAAPQDGQPIDENAIEDRRKEFRKARRAWQVVKEQAIQDLEAVKDGIRDYYLDDPEQFKIATGKLGQLDAIMDNLNDDLRDVLDRYVSTPKNRQAQLKQLSDEAVGIVNRFLDYAGKDRLLNAVDQREFADVTVKAPIEKALKDLVKTLS